MHFYVFAALISELQDYFYDEDLPDSSLFSACSGILENVASAIRISKCISVFVIVSSRAPDPRQLRVKPLSPVSQI